MIKLDDINEDFDMFQEAGSKTVDNAMDSAEDNIKELKKSFDGKYNSISVPVGKIKDFLDAGTIDNRSIIARSRNSVMQFPIYITGGIPVNVAHTIAGMFERVYATFVQTVLSQNAIVNQDEINNLVFLKKYHTNIQESASTLLNKYYEAIDDIDKIMCESIFHTEWISDNVFVEYSVVPTTDKYLIMENARLSNDPLKGFRYLQEAKKENVKKDDDAETESRTTYKVGNLPEKIVADEQLQSIVDATPSIRTIADLKKQIREGKSLKLGEGDNARVVHARRVRNGKNFEWEYYLPASDGKVISTSTRSGSSKNNKIRPSTVPAPTLLKDTEIKKINGLLPYTIKATFRIKTKDGSLTDDIEYIIGVKSIMHLISIKDLSEDLRGIIMGNVKSLQKVRYKTGEIGFVDYYFNIKGIKSDLAKHINRDKRWLNTLKRLGEYEKINGSALKKGISAMTGGHVPIPNGTMVMTQTEVSQLMDATGIDLSVVSNVKRLAKSLFLIAFVVVDAVKGTMRVLFPDKDSSWDVQSLSSVDADVAKTDNSQLMRELNRMINK